MSTVGVKVRNRLLAWGPLHYAWGILASGALGACMTPPGQTIGGSAFFDLRARH